LELIIKLTPFILPKVDKIGHTYKNINMLESLKQKNGKQSFESLPFCTQDESVLELLYKDLVQLYELRIPLKQEGLSNYSVNPNFLRDKRTNTLLQ
jgi:hypothetical protein